MPLAAMIPVAAAPVIDPAIPDASPATNSPLMLVSIPGVVFIFEDLNFTSGAYKSVDLQK
jgi:hypothetical protein